MDPLVYIIGGVVLGGLFFASAIYAFAWASRHGQLERFDQGATVIFDEEEPLGRHLDQFPNRKGRARNGSSPTPAPRP